MRELRAYSTRATITPTRFVNHYDWGNFKGNPAAWMEKCFDAFLYLANWGTHELMFRLPRRVLDVAVAKPYCCGETAKARVKGDSVILQFLSDDEEGGDWDDDGSGWLSSIIPLRADLASGDHRMLYLAWLLCVEAGGLDDDAPEPPVPPGLGTLTAPLKAFADFMRLDPDLIAAAAAASAAHADVTPDAEVARWVAALPESEKTAWLLRLANEQEVHLRAELLKAFRVGQDPHGAPTGTPRRVGELLEASQKQAEARKQREAERAARGRLRREREAAAARERHLAILATQEPEAWRNVDALIATKRPGDYDTAVQLLKDLADLAEQRGQQAEVRDRIAQLREAHVQKPSLVKRLRAAGLLAD
jgi:hypothetical protein